MVGAFACPECGQEVDAEGLAPGRLVRCGGCATWVEIPFLPRAAPARRWRHARARPPWERKALKLGLVAFGVAVAVAAAAQVAGNRFRAGRERVLDTLIAAADAADAAREPGRALVEIEAAVARAEATHSPRLAALRERRDAASARDASARLTALGTLDPARAVGEALTLRDRARTDPALASLADAVAGAVDAQRLRDAEARLAGARAASAAGRDADAFARAEQLHDRAGALPAADAARFRREAEALIASAVGRAGVAIPAVSGRFLRGSADGYNARVDPVWAAALAPKGYLPQPRRSAWRKAWDDHAPFRATFEVAETPGSADLQSGGQTTAIDAALRFEHRGGAAWQDRVVVTGNEIAPQLNAFGGARAASGGRPDPAVAARLHDEAVKRLLGRVAPKLAGIPARAAFGGDATP